MTTAFATETKLNTLVKKLAISQCRSIVVIFHERIFTQKKKPVSLEKLFVDSVLLISSIHVDYIIIYYAWYTNSAQNL